MSNVATTKGLTSDQEITSSQKTMIFILSMAVFGLSELILEIVPDMNFGIFQFGISYFAFIPATLAALFAPLQVALGSVTGKIIFSGLLMGDFGGIGELEAFIQMSLAIYVAGMLVSDPKNRKQVFWSAVLLVFIDKSIGGIVDTLKVVIGVAEFEAVEGLPASVFATEAFALVTDVLISGVIFGGIPAMLLTPRLYGKIEPMLGMKPRTARPKADLSFINAKTVTIAIILAVISGVVAFAEELGYTFLVWEPEFLDEYGNGWLWIGIIAAVVVIALVFAITRKRSGGKQYDLE